MQVHIEPTRGPIGERPVDFISTTNPTQPPYCCRVTFLHPGVMLAISLARSRDPFRFRVVVFSRVFFLFLFLFFYFFVFVTFFLFFCLSLLNFRSCSAPAQICLYSIALMRFVCLTSNVVLPYD